MAASVASMIDQFNMPNIRLLHHMGYEVHVACNFKEGNTCDAGQLQKLKKTFDRMHVIWHQWDCPRSIVSAAKCIKAYYQFYRLLQKYLFAWIHCHSPIGAALARIAAKQRGIRILYTAHGFHFYAGAPIKNWLLYFPIEKFLAKWTDVIVTVNQEDYRIATRRLKAGKIFYIPGVGIDMEKFAGTKQRMQTRNSREAFLKKYQIPKHAVVILSVGELSRRKNHRMVIAALAALKRQDLYYLICGQGPLREELLYYAARLGVSTFIRMPGYQDEMPWIYQNADIFVFPSLQEGMPVALMEAMAAGMPCVVSDIRGSKELIKRTERFSLKRFTELLDRLQRMLDNKPYRNECGACNHRHIKKYNEAVVEEQMRYIYQLFQS